MVRINGAIFFGAVDHVQSSLMAIDEINPLQKNVLVVARGITFVDVAGAEMLAQEARRRRKMGGGLYFYRCKEDIHQFLHKADKLDDIGEDHFFPTMANWIKPVYATLDPEICRNCRSRIFAECHAGLPNGEPRA
jgi:SulP family sulfate permease